MIMSRSVSLIAVLVSFLTFSQSVSAFAENVSGIVFFDKNENGFFDKGDKLLKDVMVSDGRLIVITDLKGRYHLDTQYSSDLFVILPDGYLSSKAGIQNCRSGARDFALYPFEKSESFRMAAVGDIQVDNDEELNFASRTVLSELSGRSDLDFFIHLGDLVNDGMSLMPKAAEAVNSIGTPSWCVVGNHDLDKGSFREPVTFKKEVGSDVSAFFRGKYCFVLINDVQLSDGALPYSQMCFLRALFRNLPDNKTIVLCQHIPMSNLQNKEEILSLAGNRKMLILSAHAHCVFRKIWSENVEELSVGASCGSWWTGERDSQGIPLALMQYGSPRCYFVVDFSKDGYSFSFKGVGHSSCEMASVWIKGDNSSDEDVPVLKDLPEGEIVVNVYGGGDSTKVEVSLDGKSWTRLERFKMIDPSVARIAYMNKEGGLPTRYSRRQPLRKTPSPHIWRTSPVSLGGRASGVLTFRVTDSRGLKPFEFKRIIVDNNDNHLIQN